jgi:hypothetical protein
MAEIYDSKTNHKRSPSYHNPPTREGGDDGHRPTQSTTLLPLRRLVSMGVLAVEAVASSCGAVSVPSVPALEGSVGGLSAHEVDQNQHYRPAAPPFLAWSGTCISHPPLQRRSLPLRRVAPMGVPLVDAVASKWWPRVAANRPRISEQQW